MKLPYNACNTVWEWAINYIFSLNRQEKEKMNITYKQIKSLNPCYNPIEIGMSENYEDSIVNFIIEFRTKVKSIDDILWVLCRNDFMTDKELRLYAVWCARKVQHLMKDERSTNALDVVERFANGEADQQELDVALAAAGPAARATTWVTAGAAALASAVAAARAAALASARAAAWAAAGAAARAAAWAAAGAAARVAARAAAGAAARVAQIDRLIEIFKEKQNA